MKHQLNFVIKLFIVAIVCFLAMGTTAKAQLVTENFSYSIGTLQTVGSPNWLVISGTAPLGVTSGSLSYTGFPQSGIGNKVTLLSQLGSAEDDYRQFTAQTSGTTYMSFLMNVTDTLLLHEAGTAKSEYFIGFLPSTNTSGYIGRAMARKGSAGNTFQLGLLTNTSNTTAVWSSDLNPGTTYLVVISYQIVTPGTANDIANMWINPALGGTEPAPQFTQTSSGATEPGDIARVYLRQGGNTSSSGKSQPNVSIDGIMVGTTWASVTPLSSSSSSDIITAGNETANIPYASFQASTMTTTSDGQRVWSFTVRDGGATAPDDDTYPTIVTGVTITKGASDNTTNWASTIREAALFNGLTKVAEVTVSGETITFSGLSLSVPDDGSTTLDLYLTFKTSATDNKQYQFQLTNANVTTGTGSSTFSAFSALNSDVTGDNNRVEVTATTLAFTTEPPASLAINSNFAAGVTAEDANGNIELDPISDITIGRAAGTGNVTSVAGLTKTPALGAASWSDLRYDVAETGVELSATAGALTGTSTAFTVVGLSAASNIILGPDALPGTISSLTTTQGAEVEALDITVNDGGGSADPDIVATIINSLTFTQSGANTAADWTQYIAGADLYNGVNLLGSATVNAANLSFSGAPLVSVPDDGSVTLQLKVYLKSTLPVGADNKVIGVTINQNTGAATDPAGSLFASGGADVTAPTTVHVDVSQLQFVGTIGGQKSGTAFNTSVKGTDVNGNIDADFLASVNLSVSAGNGVLSGVTSGTAALGTAAINGVIVTGGGYQTLLATSGSYTGLSNSFAVDSPAVFKVNVQAGILGAGVDTLLWNNKSTWKVVKGFDLDSIPDKNDDVILDNDYHAGNYVIELGPTIRDTCKSITIGYLGNTNTVVAWIPTTSTLTSQLVFGDAVAGNYDMMIMQGGIFVNQSGAASGVVVSIVGYSPSTDTVWIRTGGKYLQYSKSGNSALYRTSKKMDGDYGTVEFDVPDPTTAYFVSGSGASYPNLIFSASRAGTKTYSNTSSAGYGAWQVKGNLTVNIGATDSLSAVADSLDLKKDLVNYGTIKSYAPFKVFFTGADQQTVIGNTPTLGNGFIVDNVNGVALQTDVTVSGGTALINNGNVISASNAVYLNPAGSVTETNGIIDCAVYATRTLAVSTGNNNFGNIGFEINPTVADPGVTTVKRVHSWVTGNGEQSIKRYFDVTAAGTPPFNATTVFHYIATTTELNGNTEADLFQHQSTDNGATWKGKTGTISTTLKKVTTTAINTFGRFTLASASSPLYITHTITMKKFQNDNGIGVAGVAKKWYMALYENSIAPENLINSGNLSVVPTGNIPAGKYICQEADSAGWAHVGHKVDNTTTSNVFADGRSFDTITVGGGLPGTFEFYNSKSASITVNKYRDLDGDPLTTADQTAKAWYLALYQGTVSGTPVASGNTSSLVANDLAAGKYIAVEADSAGWYRCDASTKYDTVVLAGGANATLTFMNVKANTLIVTKYKDDDGDPLTTSDQTPKAWYMEIHKGSPTGTVLTSGTGTTLTNSLLADGTYYVVEADSTPWVSLGYRVNGTYQTGSAGVTVGIVSVANGQTATLDFINAPPIYGKLYRAFNPDLLSQDKDNKGKVGVSVKKSAIGVDFAFSVTAPADGVDTLHLEFGTAIDTNYDFSTVPASTRHEVTKSKLAKWDMAFATPLLSGTVVTVYGHGIKAAVQKVTSYWWMTGTVRTGAKLKNPTFTKNVKTLPMPNRINALEAAYPAAFPTGMVIGVAKTNKVDLKNYGWVLLKKSSDVMKSLSATSKGHVYLHDGTPRGLDSVIAGKGMKSLVGQYTALPPTKQNNQLFADLVALKVSIAASAQDITPVGFGDLILNDTATNPWNGLSLLQLSLKADTMMTGYAGRTFETAQTYAKLATTVRNILNAFEGPVDTSSWGAVAGLKILGAQRLADCKILKANPSATPYRIVPSAVMAETPDQYALYQNYPNPFNPTTTIQFDLPVASTVTLKIYNILGQEVATLLSNQQMEDGQQLVNFDASSLASGIYFYRISAQTVNEDGVSNTFTSVKKMMLMK